MPDSIIRKMLKPVPNALEADPAIDGLAGVVGKAASVVGLSVLEVALESTSRAAKQCEAADFIEALPENGLFFRLECETEGQIGLIALDPALVDTIDTVLTGVLDGTTLPPRPPTAVDAALCRPFIDEMLQEFSNILRELRNGKPTDTYKTARIEQEPSPHLFPEIPYLQLGINFDFLNGKGEGHISMMIPSAQTEFTSTLPLPGESAENWRAEIRHAVSSAPASLNVVLHRKKLPIGSILKLKSGDTLEIPARALENLSIESTKSSLMKARLGEYQEMRAAKITQIGEETPPDNNTEPLALEDI